MSYVDCTHPNHVDGESCKDRAVGCSPHCVCCMGEAATPIPMHYCVATNHQRPGCGTVTLCHGNIKEMNAAKGLLDLAAVVLYLRQRGITHVHVTRQHEDKPVSKQTAETIDAMLYNLGFDCVSDDDDFSADGTL